MLLATCASRIPLPGVRAGPWAPTQARPKQQRLCQVTRSLLYLWPGWVLSFSLALPGMWCVHTQIENSLSLALALSYSPTMMVSVCLTYKKGHGTMALASTKSPLLSWHMPVVLAPRGSLLSLHHLKFPAAYTFGSVQGPHSTPSANWVLSGNWAIFPHCSYWK